MAEFNPSSDPKFHPDHSKPPADPWVPQPARPVDPTAAPGKAPREDVGNGWGKPGK
jgi:hypothetical protein